MRRTIPLLMVAASVLAGCGGSGGGGGTPAPVGTTPPAPSPPPAPVGIEGLYRGVIPGNRTINAYFLDDGRYYVIYSVANDPSLISGLMEGSGTDNNGSYSSSNLKDFSVERVPTRDGSLSATYVTKQSFNGTVSYSNVAFPSVSLIGSSFDPYTNNLASISGNYTGAIAESRGNGADAASLVVLSTGRFTGRSSIGCTFTGDMTVRPRGNALALTLNMGPAPCASPNLVATGIATFNPATGRLVMATTTADRSNAVLFGGGRQ